MLIFLFNFISFVLVSAIVLYLVFLINPKLFDLPQLKTFYLKFLLKKRKKTDDAAPSTTIEKNIIQVEETSFIFELNEQIASAIDKNKIAKYITENVNKFLNTEITVLLLLDDKNKELIVESIAGLDTDKYKKINLKKDEGISWMALNNRTPVIINNLEKDLYIKGINKEAYFKKSFISVPVVHKNTLIGSLNVCDKRTQKDFTQKDIDFLLNVSRVSAIAFENSKLIKQIQQDYIKTLTMLAVIIDARDHYTRDHSDNVTKYAIAIAEELRCPTSQIETIKDAAMLHDIGKIAIKDAILLKTDKLTFEEFEIMKSHPVKGEEIINTMPFLKQPIASIVRHHHERYDGKGYPDGLRENKIELEARIIAAADTFDAMTSDRPYRKALPLDVAVEEIRKNQSTQFDPNVANALIAVINRNKTFLSGK